QDAQQHASALMGEDLPASDATPAPSPRVAQTIADGVSIYRVTNAGPLPKVLFMGGMLMGQITSEEKLLEIIAGQLTPAPQAPVSPQGPAPVSHPPVAPAPIPQAPPMHPPSRPNPQRAAPTVFSQRPID